MLVMAIEAVSQTVATNTNARAIAGFLFKQATFLAPITVGGAISDATETELRLNPVHRPHEKESVCTHSAVTERTSHGSCGRGRG